VSGIAVASTGREWDAASYDRVSDPQFAWALEVLERFPLAGDETVLDAGCGSGRVTAELLERLPRGRVIGVDASASMVEHARSALGKRASFFQADLAELTLEAPVDAVFSNAVFHWVPDHERLFGRLFAALRAGGRLAAQCGGVGNVAALTEAIGAVLGRQPFAAQERPPAATWNFAEPGETRSRLAEAGFEDIEVWLEPKRVTVGQEFLRTVTLGPHLELLSENLHDEFVEAVAADLGDPLELDYVRLNIVARRGQR
jgi:trans-aconitate 2-methyltransferase